MLTLYFSPLACSLSSRIALYEAQEAATYVQVDTHTKRVQDGSDFYAINPMGQVPALRLEDGTLITENSAILQYLAARFSTAKLMPEDLVERTKAQQWMGFIATELHKALFVPLLTPNASEDVKLHARDKEKLRLHVLDRHLEGRTYLLDAFSVADAYLVTVLNWAEYCGVSLQPYPNVHDYFKRMQQRASIARAMGEEFALFQAEMEKRKRS